MSYPKLSIEGSIILILGIGMALIIGLLGGAKFPESVAGPMLQTLTTIIGILGGYLGSKVHKSEDKA